MTLFAQGQVSRSKHHHQVVEPQDWQRIQTLYAFCRARAIDRIAAAHQQGQSVKSLNPPHELHTLDTMYAKARHTRQHDDVVTSCAVMYFRTTALRSARHPEFLGEWISPRS